MQNRADEISNLTRTINSTRNEVNSSQVSTLQGQNSSLQSLASLQSQRSSAQTQLQYMQSKLTAQQAANRTISNSLNELQRHQNDLSRKAQDKLDILNTLRSVLQIYKEVEGEKLDKSTTMSRAMSSEDISRSTLVKDACIKLSRETFDSVISKLTNKEDLNMQDQDGKTMLMHAAENGFYYGVDKLLQRGVDANIVDSKGANALIYSAMKPDIKYTKLIASRTNDLNVKASQLENSTALHILLKNDINNTTLSFEELEEELKDVPSLCFQGNLTFTISNNIVINKPFDIRTDNWTINQEKVLRITKYLVDKGADINAQDAKGLTPFFLSCCQSFNQYLVEQLINNYQIDYNLKDISGNTILHCAAAVREGVAIAQAVLSKGININIQNNGGGTPILQAAINNNVKTMKLLLRHGADLNILDNNGYHLWHYTSQYGALYSMKFLKSMNPNIISLRTNDDTSATSLHLAAEHGHLPVVQWLITEGADVNAKLGQQGFTPFFIACAKNHVPVAEYLLNHPRFNNSIVDSRGHGSLHWALKFKDVSWIDKILKKGNIDINLKDLKGYTALSWSAAYNLPQIVKFLIDKGADANIPSKSGCFAIHEAAINGALEAIKVLINYSDLNQLHTGPLKMTPLCAAILNGKTDVIQLLLERRADVNIPSSDGFYPLHLAAQKGMIEIVDLITRQCGVDINQKAADERQFTPIWAASCEGKLEMVKWLADHGANPDLPESQTNMSALLIAMFNRHSPVVEELMNREADVRVTDIDGHTILHLAARLRGRTDIAQAILDAGIDINACDKYGGTSIMVAASCNNVSMTEFLLEHGANINMIDNNGMHAWHLASSRKAIDVMQFMFSRRIISDIDYGTTDDGKTALWLASQQGHGEIIRWLAEHGAKVEAARQTDGRTALQEAILNNRTDTVKVLLELGANVNNPDKELASPLYYSLGYGCQPAEPNIVKFLVNNGANVNQPMSDGGTPMHMCGYGANVGAIKFLLAHGANIDPVNAQGKTPLHVLIEKQGLEQSQKLNTVKYLLCKSASPTVADNEGHNAIFMALENLPGAMPWLEHPETLPTLAAIEAELAGELSAWN